MDNLQKKINAQLLKQAGLLGKYACANIMEDYDFQQQLLKTETIGDAFAEVMGYESFNEYIQTTPAANKKFFNELKSGITSHWDMGLDYDDFADDIIGLVNDEIIQLTPEQESEIIELVQEQFSTN